MRKSTDYDAMRQFGAKGRTMRDYCDQDCGTCRVRKVFDKCPRGVIDDDVIGYVLEAWQIGYNEGLRFAEQAVEYALAAESPAIRNGTILCRRN
jgi:hypothetical protein